MFMPGKIFGRKGKRILDVRVLGNGWILLKTEDSKSPRDFRVITVYQRQPLKYYTPKHAHFAIDLYGKRCRDEKKAEGVFRAIVSVWCGNSIGQVLASFQDSAMDLPGYDLEYILNALDWILEQEDVNFSRRPSQRQNVLNRELQQAGIQVPSGRLGSQLAIVLLWQVVKGIHPVEAMRLANLDVVPVRR
jgi:hypothetical protein